MFDSLFEIHEVIFETYVEDTLTSKQRIQAPKEMIMASFLQTVEQIKADKRPIMVKMIRPEIIWDNFENKEKTINNEVVFSNNAMVSWQENKGAI